MQKWDEAKDSYLSNLLNIGLNKVRGNQQLSSMTKAEFELWLKTQNLTATSALEYEIKNFVSANKSNECKSKDIDATNITGGQFYHHWHRFSS